MRKLLATLLFVPTMAQAEFWTGNNLYNKLEDQDTIHKVQGIGYIMGVYDVYVNVTFCPPSEVGITVGQIKDMVHAWLRANPNQRHRNAEALVNEAFKQAWPCANRSGRGGTRL